MAPVKRMSRVNLAGLDLILDVSGALYVPDYATLLAADLHFEKGSHFIARGHPIPPFDTRSTLDILDALIERYRPAQFIALGDSFHDAHAPDRLLPPDRLRIRELAQRLRVVWIAGNHDEAVVHDLGGRPAKEILLGPVALRHIPLPGGESGCELAGHFHPVASIVTKGRRITARSFLGNQHRLVMPALGSYTGGLDARAPEIASLFPQQRFNVWMLGQTDIYRFASSALA